MDEIAIAITDGPDKPTLVWSLSHADGSQSTPFKTEAGILEAVITRMDETTNGFNFRLNGTIASGIYEGKAFSGFYSVSDRTGNLLIAN